MSLESIIDVLEASGIKLEPDLLSDCLYLAAFRLANDESVSSQPLPEAENADESLEGADKEVVETTDDADGTEEADSADSDSNQASNEEGIDVVPPALDKEGSSTFGGAFRAPGGRALPQSREILKALRPLMVRKASRRAQEVDVVKTVHQIAHTGIYCVELRPAKERWIDLAIVVDQTPSMQIWADTVDEFRRHIDSHGGFRRVSHWSLTLDEENEHRVAIRRFNSRQTRSHRELCNFSVNQLILVMTDCVSKMWTDSNLPIWFEDWGKRCSAAILQVFPQRLWPQTNLTQFRFSEVSCQSDLTPNRLLRNVSRQSSWAQPRVKSGTLVPLTTLLPESLDSFSRSMAGHRAIRLPAFDLSEKRTLSRAQSEETDRLKAFLTNASPTAKQLARLLAAAPLRLPVMRLVQRVMLPQSRQDHLAEFYLSGLIKKSSDDAEQSSPDDLQYDFVSEEVRKQLIKHLDVPEAVKVLELVSNYIADRHGTTIDFLSVVTGDVADVALPASSLSDAFARISATVLSSMGLKFQPQRATAESTPKKVDSKTISLGSTVAENAEISDQLDSLIGDSESIANLRNMIQKCSRFDNPVLIIGETGTGKSMVARLIHETGRRADSKFIQFDCAAVSDDLVAAALFGVVQGAFTGAIERAGLFEQGNKGTLFLDEFAELGPTGQAQLLQVLDRGEITRVGAFDSVFVDVRIIAATSIDLETEIKRGHLRLDFYHRLRGITISIPPLRERREDIPLLVDHFLQKWSLDADASPPVVTKKAMAHLVDHDWPGNVRELQNVLESAVILTDGIIDVDSLHFHHRAAAAAAETSIFFIASSKDSEFVTGIAVTLERQGLRASSLYTADGQGPLLGATRRAFGSKDIAAANVVLVVLSKNSLRSQSVRKGIGIALRQDKPIVCARLDDCEVPPELGRFETIDLSNNDYVSHLGRILESAAAKKSDFAAIVELYPPRGAVYGVGVVISRNRILTTAYATEGSDSRSLLRDIADGSTHETKVFWTDKQHDLAILQCDTLNRHREFPKIPRVAPRLGSECQVVTRLSQTDAPGANRTIIRGHIDAVSPNELVLTLEEDNHAIISGSAVFAGPNLIAIVTAKRGNTVAAVLLARHAQDKAFLSAIHSKELKDRPRVFISHSHSDKQFVRSLHDQIVAWDLDCWLDDNEVRFGDDIEQVIREAIGAADIFLIVLSKESLSSKSVTFEIREALRKQKSARIVCLALDGCQVPSNLDGFPVLRVDGSTDFAPLESLLRLSTSPKREPVDLSRILTKVVRETKKAQGNKRIKVYHDIERNIWVEGDEAMLRTAMQELYLNAVTHGKLDRPIAISLNASGRNCLASFENEVSELSVIDVDELFKAGISTRNSRMALGLYLVRKIIEHNGGAIHAKPIKREKGMGFRVEVQLPIAQVSDVDVPNDIAQAFENLPSPSLRQAMLASIGAVPLERQRVKSPNQIATRFSCSMDELKDYQIVLDKRQAVEFIKTVDESASLTTVEKSLTGANCKKTLGRQPSRHRNMFVFTYAELACITRINIHSKIPDQIRRDADALIANYDVRDETIADSDLLLRRISQIHLIYDPNYDAKRPSAAAFSPRNDGTPMIMTALSMLQDPYEELAGYPEHVLISIRAKELRELGLNPVHNPTKDNPARVLVEGDLSMHTRGVLARTFKFYSPDPTTNIGPRSLCLLALDCSASMSGQKIAQLNEGLMAFKNEIMSDELARSRVEVGVVTFGDMVRIEQPFCLISDFAPPKIVASGATSMGEAIAVSCDIIENRKAEFRQQGIEYFQTWLFLITDGSPTDEWQKQAAIARQQHDDGAVNFVTVGVEGADMNILEAIAPRSRPPIKLAGLRFPEMFRWLSSSIASAGSSDTRSVDLPTIDSWGKMDFKAQLDPTRAHGPFLNEVAPVRPDGASLFVGRRQELDELAASLRSGETTVVYGDRGIGKTSLALALQHQLRDRGESSSKTVECVIHSCVDTYSREDVQFDDQLHILLQQLEGKSRVPPLDNRKRLEQQFRACVSQSAEKGQLLAVILDDADFLQRKSLVAFLSLFRSNDVSCVVMCGTKFGIDFQSAVPPLIEHSLSFVKIGPLSPSEVERLLERGLRRWNSTNRFGIQIEKEAIARVAEATAGIPRLVCVLANRIVESLLADGESTITPAVVERELAHWSDRTLQSSLLSALDRVSDRRLGLSVLRAIEHQSREVVAVSDLKEFASSELLNCLKELAEVALVDFDARAQTVRLHDLTKALVRMQNG